MSIDEIKKAYELMGRMTTAERFNFQNEQRQILFENKLIDFIQAGYMELFISGSAGTRFPQSDGLAFTNAGVVLYTVYSVYKKHPEMHVDTLFHEALIKMLDGPEGLLFTALNTIHAQLCNERIDNAPFKLDNPELFKKLKESISNNITYLKKSTSYRGKLYENGLYGFVEDIAARIEEQKGISVL